VRILYLADRLSARGGADLYLAGLLAAQADRHELLLAVGGEDGTGRASCPVVRVQGLGDRTRCEIELDSLLRNHAPDIVHVHNVVNPAVLEWAAGRRALVTVQDHRFFCPGRGKWTADGEACAATMGIDSCEKCFTDREYFHAIHSLTVERLAALKRLPVTVLSSYMRRELVDAGVPADRIHVVPPFVHGLDRDLAANTRSCVLFVGRLVAAKGPHEAVAAWRRSGVELPLRFVGTGPLRRELEAQGFEVCGWLPHERMASCYRSAAALLMPSRWQEPFGIAGLEALTLGTPVVAWDSGGIREWHPGPGLVRWGDVEGLAAALRVAVDARIDAPAPGFGSAASLARMDALYARIASR